MLSGATLIGYTERYNTNQFVKKRFERVVIPFLAWSLWYMVYRHGIGYLANPLMVLDDLINTKTENIYWFFPTIFGYYMIMPLLSEKRGGYKTFWPLIVLLFLTVSVFPTMASALGLKYNSALAPQVGGYMIYFLLGYLLSHEELPKRWRLLAYVAGVAGFLVLFLGTIFRSLSAGSIDNLFRGYLNFPCVLMAIAIFVWAKYHDWTRLQGGLGRALPSIASTSLGVYLIQPVFVYDFPGIFGFSPYSIVWRTVGALVVYAVMVCIVLLLKRIPVLRRIVP